MLYIGADHAGFKLKESLKKFFQKNGIQYVDLGYHRLDPKDDYPDIALKLSKKVSSEKNAKGILICGNGEGVCIVANKVKGIRAVLGYSEYAAKTSRQDDDSNILCLAGRVLKVKEAKKIVLKWLKTDFSKLPRHKRRLKKIRRLENSK